MKTRLFAALSGKATLSPSKSLEDCLRNIYDEEDDSTKSPGSPYWFQRPRRLSGRIYDVSQEEQDESFLDLPTPEDPQKVVEAGKVFVPNEDEEWEDLGDDIAVELDGNEVANGVAVETDAIAEDVEELVRCEDGTTTEKVDLQYSTFVGNAHSPAGSPHSTTSNPHTAPKSLPSRNPFKRTSPTQRNQQSSPRETSVTPPSKSTDEMTQGCFFEKGWQSNLPDTVYTTDYQPTSDHQTNPSHLPTFGQPPTPSNPLSQDINKEPLVRTGSYETVKNPTDILTNEDMPSWVGAHLCLRKPTGNERCEKESPEKGNDGLKRVSDGFEVQSVSGSEHFV